MSEVQSWSTTAASNNGASPNGFAEGMAPSGVNDSARELMAAIAKYRSDTDGVNSSTGSANAYALAASRVMAAYAQGDAFVFKANFTNTAASTLNVDALGAKGIRKNHDKLLEAGDIQQDQIVSVVYQSTDGWFEMVSPTARSPSPFWTRSDGSTTVTLTSANTWYSLKTAVSDEVRDADAVVASGVFTAPATGWYLFGGGFQLGAVPDGAFTYLGLGVNGIVAVYHMASRTAAGALGAPTFAGARLLYLAASDTVELAAQCTEAGLSTVLTAGTAATFFTGARIG